MPIFLRIRSSIEQRKIIFVPNNYVGLYDTNDETDIRFNIFNQTNVFSKVENVHSMSLEIDQNIDKELKIKLNEAFPSIWINNYAATFQKDKISNKTQESYRNKKDKIGRGITNNRPSKRFELVLPFAGRYFFDDKLGLVDDRVTGVKLGYIFNLKFAAELEGGITPAKTTSDTSGKISQFFVNGRYTMISFPVGQSWMSFYATAGPGYMYLRGFGTDDEAVAYQAGAGITFEVRTWLGLRVDTRYIGIDDITKPGTTTLAGATKNFQSTVGLVFWF